MAPAGASVVATGTVPYVQQCPVAAPIAGAREECTEVGTDSRVRVGVRVRVRVRDRGCSEFKEGACVTDSEDRSALALGKLLNRIVILPLFCQVDMHGQVLL